MAEKVVNELRQLDLNNNNQVDDEYQFGKDFLQVLCHKVGQLEQACITQKEANKNLIIFSCDIPKIQTNDLSLPTKLIELIDDLNLQYFFKEKPKNLYSLNWCSKYLMFSYFANQEQVNTIQFYWFKNKFGGSLGCPCFMWKFNIELCQENDSG